MNNIDFLHKKLTSIVEDGLDLSWDEVEDECCTLCGREPRFQGIRTINSYKVSEVRCRACQSFFISNPTVLGIENPKKPDTGQKFGMLSGNGCYIAKDRQILFMPPGSYKKLPKRFFELGIEVVQITQSEQLKWLRQQELSFPCLYVCNFGRKTQFLIRNLELSLSKDNFIMCSDDELNSSNYNDRIVDLEKMNQIIDVFNTMSSKKVKEYLLICGDYFTGKISPKNLEQYMESLYLSDKNSGEKLIEVLSTLLPKDPHAALWQIQLIKMVLK